MSGPEAERVSSSKVATGRRLVLSVGIALFVLTPFWSSEARADDDRRVARSSVSEACLVYPDTAGTPAEFYQIDLVPTGIVPGTGAYSGTVTVTFRDSPFDVAVSARGSFARRLEVDLKKVKPPRSGGYVVWVASAELDRVRRVGVIDERTNLTAETALTKFLVVVTLEEQPEESEERWEGPVVFRGMSRSGYMHTLAGHGPFQQEPCARYGF